MIGNEGEFKGNEAKVGSSLFRSLKIDRKDSESTWWSGGNLRVMEFHFIPLIIFKIR